MDLKQQVISMLFSFFFGLFLGGVYNLNYNLLFKLTNLKKFFFNIIFIFDLVLIYFIVIKKINGGIIHPYFYLLIILGFIFTFSHSKSFRRFIKVSQLKKKKDKHEEKDKDDETVKKLKQRKVKLMPKSVKK